MDVIITAGGDEFHVGVRPITLNEPRGTAAFTKPDMSHGSALQRSVYDVTAEIGVPGDSGSMNTGARTGRSTGGRPHVGQRIGNGWAAMMWTTSLMRLATPRLT